MTANNESNRHIAKNTLILYFRLFFTMGISLYTSRIVLATLGIEDFGIYNVVGGVIVMLSVINASMSSATSRFLSFALAEKNERLNTVFSSALIIHVFIAIIVIVLAETVGLWFVKNRLVIPPGRESAAIIVYQLSVLVAGIGIIQVPYVASIFSHERIGVYAFVEILNAVLKLVSVLILQIIFFDKLILYAFFIATISLISFAIYKIYTFRHFAECKFHLLYDRTIIKPMLSFSGWDLYGNISSVARFQGVNMLLNMFFGPILNAANGIAMQVQAAVSSFSSNLLMAVRPQIIKSYAKNETSYTIWLLTNTVKLTTLLLLILCLPLILEMPFVLSIWLKDVPDYAISFCQLTLMFTLIANLSQTMMSAIHATGKVKWSSILNGTIYLSVIPSTYFAFKKGFLPITPLIINVIFVGIGSMLNIFYLKHYIPLFSIAKFARQALLPCFGITCISLLPSIVLIYFYPQGWTRLILVILSTGLSIILGGYWFALDDEMKLMLKTKIKHIISYDK